MTNTPPFMKVVYKGRSEIETNYAVFRPDLLTAAARIAFGQWFKYSDQQKVEPFLFGSSDLSNSENVEIFSHVQYFISESNRFSISFCGHYN